MRGVQFESVLHRPFPLFRTGLLHHRSPRTIFGVFSHTRNSFADGNMPYESINQEDGLYNGRRLPYSAEPQHDHGGSRWVSTRRYSWPSDGEAIGRIIFRCRAPMACPSCPSVIYILLLRQQHLRLFRLVLIDWRPSFPPLLSLTRSKFLVLPFFKK